MQIGDTDALEELKLEEERQQKKLDELATEIGDLKNEITEMEEQICDLDLEVEQIESSQAKVKSEILALRIKLAIIPCSGQLRLDQEN